MPIYHKHHIIPKHMGGSDDPSNLIELTIEEHAEAHKKLWEQHGRWQDKVAWMGLSNMLGKEEIIKEVISNTNKNKIVTEETRNKLRMINIGKTLSEKTKKKMSFSKKGIPKSEIWKKNASLRRMGINNPMYGKPLSIEMKQKLYKTLTCPKCNKTMTIGNYNRWKHGETCDR